MATLSFLAATVAVLLGYASRQTAAMHGWKNASSARPSGCVKPGRCAPPLTKFSHVLPVTPRQQWNIEGGCVPSPPAA